MAKTAIFHLKKKKKILILALLMFSGALIYNLPYFRSTFFTPLQDALGLQGENAKYGMLGSVYGLLALVFYIPGGWLADTVSTKKLLSGSLIATGLLGFWFSTWPSYPIAMLIMGLWAVTSVLTYWSAYIKIINMLSETPEESAQNYGCVEGGGGVVNLLFAFITLGVFSFFGATSKSLTASMLILSAVITLTGILMAFVLPEPENGKDRITARESLKGLLLVLKMPVTYMLAMAIFGCYMVYSGANYFMPYMETAFALSATLAGAINVLRTNAMRMIAGPLFGRVGKRLGRSTIIMKWAYVALIVLLGILVFIPSVPRLLPLVLIIIFAIGFALCGIRAVYWSLIDQMETPIYAVGSITGFASLVGYLPDTFVYSWFGGIIDKHKGVGAYHLIFLVMIGFLAMSGIVMFIADKLVKRKQEVSKLKLAREISGGMEAWKDD